MSTDVFADLLAVAPAGVDRLRLRHDAPGARIFVDYARPGQTYFRTQSVLTPETTEGFTVLARSIDEQGLDLFPGSTQPDWPDMRLVLDVPARDFAEAA